ncbi:hypothetical protein ACTHQ4_20140 [Alkalicoccobacillus gibsonii]|uniref:hypothetical protein n=1 Tax=Alkalicoccobacillus gibsonii TaxID=79881 RepID=UPI003F7B7B69
MELTIQVIVAILALVTGTLTGGTIFIKHWHTSDIEEILLTQRDYAIKMFVHCVFITSVLYVFASTFNYYMFSQIRIPLTQSNYTSFYALMIILFLITVLTLIYLFLTKKSKPILFVIISTLMNYIVNSLAFIFFVEPYSISNHYTWANYYESFNLTSYLISVVVCALIASFMNFAYFSEKNTFLNRVPVTVRLMTKVERNEIFLNGMFTLYSVKPDIQIVRPSFYEDKRNSYPKYLYYALTDEVHIFERKDETLEKSNWIPRKERHKRKVKKSRRRDSIQ